MGPTRATSDEKEGHYHYNNNNNNNNRNKIMEKKKKVKEAAAAAAVVTMKFGDEQSDLLDQYERRSFEVHLNLAMQLGRSLSSPGAVFHAPTSPFLAPNTPPTAPPQLLSQVRQGRRGRPTGLKKVLWKLLLGVPMIIVRSRGKKKEVPDHKDPKFWKSFSRSLKI